MKRYYLTLIILISYLSCALCPEAKASILKNILFWKTKEQSTQKISPDTTLKAKAVYLELEGDNVEYDHEKNIYITSGMSIAHIIDQDAILEADQIIYYGNEQNVEAIGNIKITREDVVSTGKSFTFDVTSNKYLLTDPETKITGAIVKARKTSSLPDEEGIEYTEGTLQLDDPVGIAQGFGSRRKHPRSFYSFQKAIKSEKPPTWDDIPKNRKYKVTAEKIVYDSTKEIRNLTIYGARVQFTNFSIPAPPKVTLTVNSDERVRSAPLLLPTFGTQGALGGFALGPNFNFNLTNYHLISLSPFGQIGDGTEFGLGGRVGLAGPTTKAEFAYGSLKDRFVGEFRQKLFRENTELRAGWNQYFENGFLGRTLPEYEIGIVDKRVIKFPLPITEGGIMLRTTSNWSQTDAEILPTKFRDFLHDEGNPRDFEKSAFKIEEQLTLISKPLFKFGGDKLNTALRLKTQNAARVYSTGDFQTILTGGPIVDSTVGPASFEVGYAQGLVKGESPLLYDQYIQGMQSLLLDGDIKLHEWITLGGYGTYNIKAEEVVDKQIRAKIGPKDFKMLVNWDALRQQTQFGLNFLFGQPVDFERFIILNSLRKVGGM